MVPNSLFTCLRAKWLNYLINSNHSIYIGDTEFYIIRSRDCNNKRYRWLLLLGYSPKRVLNIPERRMIHRHIRKAKTRKEKLYLVVGFTQEPARIIILPAVAALKSRYISSDKGGIDWDD